MAALSAVATLALLNRGAAPLRLLGHPDDARKNHPVPIPLTGGLAILSGVWAGTALICELPLHLPMLILLGLVAAVHLTDDRKGLPARLRLALDALLAFGFVGLVGGETRSLGHVAGVDLTLGALALPVTLFVYVALSNAFNMVDGLDGLAAEPGGRRRRGRGSERVRGSRFRGRAYCGAIRIGRAATASRGQRREKTVGSLWNGSVSFSWSGPVREHRGRARRRPAERMGRALRADWSPWLGGIRFEWACGAPHKLISMTAIGN